MDAITVLRKSLKDVAGYKNNGLSKSLELLVLRLELGSAFLMVFLLCCVLRLVSVFLVVDRLIFDGLLIFDPLPCFCAAGGFMYPPAETCPERKGGGTSSKTP